MVSAEGAITGGIGLAAIFGLVCSLLGLIGATLVAAIIGAKLGAIVGYFVGVITGAIVGGVFG